MMTFTNKYGKKTIELFSKKDFVHAYTDSSSDSTITSGGCRVFFITPNATTHEYMFRENATYNYTFKLQAIVQAPKMYKALPPTGVGKCIGHFCDTRVALQAVSKEISLITNKVIFFLLDIKKTEQNLLLSIAVR